MANSDEEKDEQSETPEEDSEETAPENADQSSQVESEAEDASGDEHEDDQDHDHEDASEAEDASEDEQEHDHEDASEAESDDDHEDASEAESENDPDHEDESEDDHEDASEADEASAEDETTEDEAKDGGEAEQEDDDTAETSDDDGDESGSDDASDHGDDELAASDDRDGESETSTTDDAEESEASDGDIPINRRGLAPVDEYERSQPGTAAFFDHPDELLEAARQTRDSEYEEFDAYSPFAIHGMDEAMGLGRSWIPWVTFAAGLTGFLTACALEFGTMTFDWPMIIGGKPFAPWPAFVPVMFELTVLIGGVTTGVVMLKAAGCFEPADIIDPDITDDRFALWISADDDHYDEQEAVEFARSLGPTEVRTYSEKADSDG